MVDRSDDAFNFGEGQVPWVTGDEFAACMRLVGFDTTGTKQDVDAFTAQILGAAAERGACGQG